MNTLIPVVEETTLVLDSLALYANFVSAYLHIRDLTDGKVKSHYGPSETIKKEMADRLRPTRLSLTGRSGFLILRLKQIAMALWLESSWHNTQIFCKCAYCNSFVSRATLLINYDKKQDISIVAPYKQR